MRSLPFTFIALLISISYWLQAQDTEWAITLAAHPNADVVAIRQDADLNIYIASVIDSSQFILGSWLEKRNAQQELLWQIQVDGDFTFSDMEIDPDGNPHLVGYFKGHIQVDTLVLDHQQEMYTGFVIEIDRSGNVRWVKKLDIADGNFYPVDLFIGPNGEMYLTSDLINSEMGYCSFHKMDAAGNLLKNEFNFNSDNRSFSRILADGEGNVYLSGTCGNLAEFDDLFPPLQASYQNFIVKYDSSFQAQWILAREYATFDHNNSIGTDGESIYWAFDEFTGNQDTVRIVKVDFDGNILREVIAPKPELFLPTIEFSVDGHGYTTLIFNRYSMLHLFRYDPDLNLVWQDTVRAESPGFSTKLELIAYDSSFYLSGGYWGDSLHLNSHSIINPNAENGYARDLFVAKWQFREATSATGVLDSFPATGIYPNPFSSHLWIDLLGDMKQGSIRIIDSTGRTFYQKSITEKSHYLSTSDWPSGIYFIQISLGNASKLFKIIKQ